MRKSLLLALSLLGLWDSSYLWWVYTSPSRPMVCLGTGCDVVRASRYASFWGHPLPLYGIILYATLALLVFAEPLLQRAERSIRYAMAIVAGAGFLFSLYLTGIEAYVLHAWCAWCVVSALTVTAIFALALYNLARPTPSAEQAGAQLQAIRTYFLLFLVALGIGTPAFLLLARHGELPPAPPVAVTALNEHLVRPDSHAVGNPQASVTVVEFGDFECWVCGRAETEAEQIRRTYKGQIRFIFRQFPLTAIHLYAETAAEASECAAEQGKFWEALEKFYEKQNDLSEPALDRYAGELGLDQARFRQCLSSGKMAGRVRRDLEDGRAIGVRSTPTFFVGRQKIEGLMDREQFSRWLSHELVTQGQGAGKTPSSQALPLGNTGSGSSSTVAGTSPGEFGSNPTNTFGQFQTSSALTCSEEELKKRQPTLIRTREAREYFERDLKTVFVDVRPSKDFDNGRIRRAVSVPVDQIEQRWNRLPKDRKIILYEGGQSPGDVCASSRAAARVLFAHGFSPDLVKVYQEGLVGWEKAGLPVHR